MLEMLKNYSKKMTRKSTTADLPTDSYCKTINGTFKTSQCVVDEKLKINGAAILNQNTVIKKPIVINGQLEATGSLIEEELFTNGTANITNSSFKRKAHFSGNLTARDCQFSEPIFLLAHNTNFIHCQIDHIIILALPQIKAPQKIHLSNSCEITGDIIFEAGNGEVWIEKESLISGKVHGARIINT